MTNKNEVGYWIKRKGNTKLSDTLPERSFKTFADSKGYEVTKGEPIYIDGWELRPDFDMQLGTIRSIVVLIDGRYHWTDAQAKKDRWRDGLYNKAGKKVIHIDSPLTEERYWLDLASLFQAAVVSKKEVEYIRQ